MPSIFKLRQLNEFNDQLKDDKEHDFESLKELITRQKEATLQQHFHLVLPLSLQLLEHHHLPNKILGVQCVNHILNTIPSQDLRAQGSDKLLLHSLKQLLYFCDDAGSLLSVVLPSLLGALKALRLDACNVHESQCDEIFDVILTNLQMTTHEKQVALYWSGLPGYVNFMGLASVKYTKRLIDLCCEQVSHTVLKHDRGIFDNVVETLLVFVKVSKGPCNYIPQVFMALFKSIYSNFDVLIDDSTIENDRLADLWMALQNKDAPLYEELLEIIKSKKEAKIDQIVQKYLMLANK